MTILLTTPFDPGDNDDGNTYPRVKLVNVELMFTESVAVFTFEFGDVVDNKWVKGPGANSKQIILTPAQFNNVFSGENITNKVETHLINSGKVVGTIE